MDDSRLVTRELITDNTTLCVRLWMGNSRLMPLDGQLLVDDFRWTTLDRLLSTMRIKEGDEWETAFRTRYGHFEYQVMPFGLSNTPASFQGYVNKILAKKLDILVIVYLDDILIYTEDPGQGHVGAVQWVLDVLRKHGFFANLKKCRFHKDKVRSWATSYWPRGYEWKTKG